MAIEESIIKIGFKATINEEISAMILLKRLFAIKYTMKIVKDDNIKL